MSIRDLLPWQSLTTKGDSRTTPQPSNQGLHVGHTHGGERGFSRRRFIHTAVAPPPSPSAPGFLLGHTPGLIILDMMNRYRNPSRFRERST